MGANSEVEKEERRRKPWMQIEVRGGGGLLVLGGALIAAGLGAAFAAHRAHVSNQRRRSATTRPADEVCKVVESLDEGISCHGEGGQLDEVCGDAARGLASVLALDPILSSPTIKLAEEWQGEFMVHSPVETQENIDKIMIDHSPSFKHLEIGVATEVRIVETDAADGHDSIVQEFLLGGPESGMVQNQKEQPSEEPELVNLKESKEEEFSFSVVEFTKIQDKINQKLEESGLDRVQDEEEKDDREGGEVQTSEEVEEFSFRAVESDTIQNQTKQTLEESKITHAREQNGGGEEGEESNDDVGAPSSESQEDETQSSAKGESEREEEGSDGTRASSIESSAEAVWPAEVIEQEELLFMENQQEIEEESCEEKVTAAQAEKEIEEYEEKFVDKVASAEESVGMKIGARLKTMKRETKIDLMPVNYSNRFLLLLLALALALSLISFARRDHLHHFCLAKLCHHLYQVFFSSNNAI
ncbi:uncharacterized protein [Elaeis guineensis]|uniref:Uncharacterized protein LOC105052547 n=1 Tax=Elaeis guineensis var. tenera TaxID=51953 RepID=A0A6I9S1B1_ELAGV|nr:uncharacterized protein LOC105052547 [Elaeis guineensis]